MTTLVELKESVKKAFEKTENLTPEQVEQVQIISAQLKALELEDQKKIDTINTLRGKYNSAVMNSAFSTPSPTAGPRKSLDDFLKDAVEKR